MNAKGASAGSVVFRESATESPNVRFSYGRKQIEPVPACYQRAEPVLRDFCDLSMGTRAQFVGLQRHLIAPASASRCSAKGFAKTACTVSASG